MSQGIINEKNKAIQSTPLGETNSHLTVHSKRANPITLSLIFITTYFFSSIIGPYHTGGDQEHYNLAYLSIKGLDIINAFDSYKTIIYTSEPIHFIITWVFSNLGVEKDILMSFANAILAVLFYATLIKRGCNPSTAAILLLSNYYLLAMYFTLERTKFAFIFLLAFILYEKAYLLVLSIFSHVFIVIPAIFNIISSFLQKSNNYGRSHAQLFPGIIIKYTLLASILYFGLSYLGSHVSYKFAAYSGGHQESSALVGGQIILMLIFTMFSTKQPKTAILYFLGILAVAAAVGGARINILAYFGFLYYSDLTSKNFKLLALMLAPYLLFKCIGYMLMIINTGG